MTLSSAKQDRSDHVRAAIRAAATILFTENGYTATGVREIAEQAGVNPAIVIRHFGSKEALFIRTMNLPDDWDAAFEGPLEELGRRVVRRVMDVRGENLRVYAALMQASNHPEIGARLRDIMGNAFTAPLIERLGGADATLRAHLFAAQLEGLLVALAIREDPALTELDPDVLVERYGDLLQASITG